MANPIITRIQVEGNDVVSFLNGTTPPYTYVRSMSQILPQSPTYISYRYDSITISQVGGEAFTFTVYTILQVGGNAFTALNFQDPATTVQAKTVEIYRLLVTSIFKGCCECGNTEPECAIQYTYGNSGFTGEFDYTYGTPGLIRFNDITGNNQNFSGFFPLIPDGSWVFLFSKTDPTVYAVLQLSNYSSGGGSAGFDAIELNAAGTPFVEGTEFCIDFTSVGGSLVQGWQDTLNINPNLNQDNTIDGGGYDFVFDNNASFTINGPGGSLEVDAFGPAMNAGTQQILVTAGYIDINTPLIGLASPGWVLSLTASGHVEYAPAATGTVSSVGLSMPSAFTVTNSPVISSGTLTVTGAGTSGQYIDGTGALQTFPTIPTPNVYTVDNGLSPQTTPTPNPNNFQLGGPLVQDTTVDGVSTYSMTFNALDGFFANSIADTFLTSQTSYNNWTPISPTAPTYTHHDVNPGYNWMETRDTDIRDGSITYNQLYMKSALFGTKLMSLTHSTSSINVGLSLGIHSSFSTTTPCITLTTTNVAANTATVGQVLTLKSMTGSDKGRVEFETITIGTGTVTSVGLSMPPAFTVTNSPVTTLGTLTVTGVGTSAQYIDGTGALQNFPALGVYDSNQGIYKDTVPVNDTFMLGAPLGSETSIPFLIDRYVYTDTFKLALRGNPTNSAIDTAYGAVLQVSLDSSTTGDYAAAIKADTTLLEGKNIGIVIDSSNLGMYIESASESITTISPGLSLLGTTRNDIYLNQVVETARLVRDTVVGGGSPSVGFGNSLVFQLNDNNSIVPTASANISSYYSNITTGVESADMAFSVTTANGSGPLAPGIKTVLTLRGQNGEGQIQFNEYGQTPANFPASPVWALGVDSSGNVVEFTPSGGGTVTSVDLSVPTPVNPAFSVSGNPITTSGTLAISANGTSAQYIDGTGALQTFPSLTGYVPYTGATQDVDLDTFKLSTKSVYITGTAGNGHLHMKHQSADATATGQSTVLWADSNGDIKWKNDGQWKTTLKTSSNTADRVYTFPDLDCTLVPTTRSISTTPPLTGGGDLSADRTLSIANAAADGSTKGAAAFTASDFDDNGSGLISIDYTNGQKATASQPGFLTAADWTTFNSKPAGDSIVFASSPNNITHTTGTSYWSITGSVGGALENNRVVIMPCAGILKNFYVRIGAAAGSTSTITMTIRKNGVNSSISVTFVQANGSNFTLSDTTNTLTVAAGDRIVIESSNSGSQSGGVVSTSILLERT
jgi:hypothetical protein